MEKRDISNQNATYNNWKELVKEYRIEGISKAHSNLIIKFISDMEEGINTGKRSKRGPRSKQRLNVLRLKLIQFIKFLEKRKVKDVTTIDVKQLEKELISITNQLNNGEIKRLKDNQPYQSPGEFISAFRTFWHWWMQINRKEGKLILDVCEYLNSENKTNTFVYLTKEQTEQFIEAIKFDKQREKYLEPHYKILIAFLFDSIVRFPSEALSIKVKDIYLDKDAVCVNISPEVGTKTKSSIRNFNLLYCGDKIRKYIELNNLQPDDYVFKFMKDQNHVCKFNKKIKEVAVKLFGDGISHPVAGGRYSELSGYDFRHNGAINLTKVTSESNISLDKVKKRGGWADYDMLNYYTKFLGIDAKIDKILTLTSEDKSRLEKELNQEKEKTEKLGQEVNEIKEKIRDFKTTKKYKISQQITDDFLIKQVEKIINEELTKRFEEAKRIDEEKQVNNYIRSGEYDSDLEMSKLDEDLQNAKTEEEYDKSIRRLKKLGVNVSGMHSWKVVRETEKKIDKMLMVK